MKLDEFNLNEDGLSPEDAEYFRENLWEMSNFWPKDTGLPNGIKMWVREEPKGLPHTKYRIKFKHTEKGIAIFSLWGDDTQQVGGPWKPTGKTLKKIKYLVNALSADLRQHIDGETSSVDLTQAVTNIKSDVEKI